MFLLIALIVGILVAVGGTVLLARSSVTVTKDKFGGESVTMGRPAKRLLLIPAVWLLGIAIIIFGTGFREIGPGQLGVRTAWGQVQDGTLRAGLNWVNPIWENIVIYDGRVVKHPFADLEGATDDLQAVRLTGQINYYIDPEAADDILREIGGPDEYAAKVFTEPAAQAIKDATPRYSAQDIVGKRREIGNIAKTALAADMEQFHIVVDAVTISNIGLNQAFLDSVEAKQIAEQGVQTATFNAQAAEQTALGEANAAIARAGGEAERIRVVAQAQADANDEINSSLTPNLLQWQTIQKLSDKVRLMLLPSDQGLIFDLKGLQDEEQPAQ